MSQPDKQDTWNHKTPVVFSPLFSWPPKPKAALLTLTKRWLTISRNVLFLGMAFLVFHFLVPEKSSMQSLSLSWAGPISLRSPLLPGSRK